MYSNGGLIWQCVNLICVTALSTTWMLCLFNFTTRSFFNCWTSILTVNSVTVLPYLKWILSILIQSPVLLKCREIQAFIWDKPLLDIVFYSLYLLYFCTAVCSVLFVCSKHTGCQICSVTHLWNTTTAQSRVQVKREQNK